MKKIILLCLTLTILKSYTMENSNDEKYFKTSNNRFLIEALQEIFKKETAKLSNRDAQKAYYAAETIAHYSSYEKINTKQSENIDKAIKTIQKLYPVWGDTEKLPGGVELFAILLASQERYQKKFCKNKMNQNNEQNDEELHSTKIIFSKKENAKKSDEQFNAYLKNIQLKD